MSIASLPGVKLSRCGPGHTVLVRAAGDHGLMVQVAHEAVGGVARAAQLAHLHLLCSSMCVTPLLQGVRRACSESAKAALRISSLKIGTTADAHPIAHLRDKP